MVLRPVAAPRVSVLPIRRMAAAGYMAGPALVQRPKRGWRDSRRDTPLTLQMIQADRLS
ncbi:MAG: hypothetical protein VXW07_05815 [Pseudomonadota bacterium]|nr:hypothetical protein [Pseudomonadota bacterium]